MSSVKKIGIPSNIPLKSSNSGVDGNEAPSRNSALMAAAGGGDQIQRDIRIYSQYFRRYELLIEYKNLKNPDHCPNGMYIMPEASNLYEWWGVLILHRGYYKEGVFKFHIQIPDDYPNEGPTVRFITDMFHPLIDRSGFFNLRHQFPAWRANKDYLSHVFHFIKNSFKDSVLASLDESNCPNREACQMYHQERPLFARLASQCAQLSASDGILFSNDLTEDDPSIIRFSPLDDESFDRLKAEMIASVNVQKVDKSLQGDVSANRKSELLSSIKSVTGNIHRMLSS